MKFREQISRRQSCRSFDPDKTVEDDAVFACIQAAKMAPSAMNNQPYDIWVVREANARALVDAKASFNKFMDNCPVFVVFTDAPYNNDRLETAAGAMGIDYRTQDIGEAIAYFTLQAEELGLATCIIGSFDISIVQSILGTDAHIQAIVALGYSNAGYAIREKVRKPFSENVHFL